MGIVTERAVGQLLAKKLDETNERLDQLIGEQMRLTDLIAEFIALVGAKNP